jgi:hypothetical protein
MSEERASIEIIDRGSSITYVSFIFKTPGSRIASKNYTSFVPHSLVFGSGMTTRLTLRI